MITKLDKERKQELGKFPYYVALSAMQKAIRCGREVHAVNFAKVVWRYEPYKGFSRLWTILFEDVGRDINALLTFFKYRGGYSKFENLIPLIRALAHGRKTGDVGFATSLIRSPVNEQKFYELTKGTVHEKLYELRKRWETEGLEAYSVWDYGVGDTNYDWTIELAERSFTWDHEKFATAVPYFFTIDRFQITPDIHIQNEIGDEEEDYEGWFPLRALDTHTYPGKMAYSTYLKYRPHPLILDSNELGKLIFIYEGCLRNNAEAYNPSITRIIYGCGAWSKYITEEYKALMETVLPEMAKVRTWVLKNVFAEDMRKLRTIYKESWVNGQSCSLEPLIREESCSQLIT